MYNGYDFNFKIGNELLTLPITPEELTIKVGSNNKVVTLINEGDINILKSPALTEFEFDARFPMRKYPYSRDPDNFEDYLDKFTELKTKKKSFIFSVIRKTPAGKGTWGTSRRVALEDLEVKESADEGDDVILTFKLKEYKEYGVIFLNGGIGSNTPNNSNRNDNNKGSTTTTHTVKEGDCLWNIAKLYYGDGSKYPLIYEANKSLIDNRNKGYDVPKYTIYPNQVLTIPGIEGGASSAPSGTTTTTTSTSSSSNRDVRDTPSREVLTENSYTLRVVVNGAVLNQQGYSILVKYIPVGNGLNTQTKSLASGDSVRVRTNTVVNVTIDVPDGVKYRVTGGSWFRSKRTFEYRMTSNRTITIEGVTDK